VAAVDAVGAGDAFVAALTWGLLEGRDLLASATTACTAGALAVTRPGARSSPTRAELLGA
jgi:ribokinase